jgi:hypothetical protein
MALTTLLVLFGVVAAHTVRRRRADASADMSFSDSESARIVVTNEYGGQPRSISRGMYSNMSALVEPFRESNLTISGDDAGSVVWSVHDESSDETVLNSIVTSSAPHTLTHMFTGVAHVYLVSAVASSATTALRVTCKCVRRELLDLDYYVTSHSHGICNAGMCGASYGH